MFNILIIIALSAVLAGQVCTTTWDINAYCKFLQSIKPQTLSLDWRPLFRDSFVYGLSIAVFIGFAWDGKFQWWEALILFLLYVGYIVVMKFNPYLMKLLEKIECKWCRYVAIMFEKIHLASTSYQEYFLLLQQE